MSSSAPAPLFSVLVPVKSLAGAKSRLSGLDQGARSALMRAFALDAVEAALAARLVGRVYVVSDEPDLAPGSALALPDEGEGDLNRALVHAALRARLDAPDLPVAALLGDLPCLRPDDLDHALATGLSPRWFVADAAGTGTSLLAAGPRVDLDPHFGADSARRHEESGAVPVRAEVPTLRRDVDTDADLAAARALGVGSHTSAVLASYVV